MEKFLIVETLLPINSLQEGKERAATRAKPLQGSTKAKMLFSVIPEKKPPKPNLEIEKSQARGRRTDLHTSSS